MIMKIRDGDSSISHASAKFKVYFTLWISMSISSGGLCIPAIEGWKFKVRLKLS